GPHRAHHVQRRHRPGRGQPRQRLQARPGAPGSGGQGALVRSVSADGEARASVYDGRFMEDPVTLIPRSLFWRTLAVWALPLCALAADKTPSAPDPAHQGAALVAKAVEAFGGAAAVDSVSALEVRSSGTRHVQTDDLPVVTISRFFFPDRYYQELQMPMGTMKTVLGP